MVGMMFAVAYSVWDNKRYVQVQDKHGGFAPPEARLPPTLIASIAIPIGLFWFAWTNYPSIHWIVCILAGAPFGFGMVLVFLGIMNYLIDAYTIFAASVLAANSVLRSIFGAVFPLFTTYMYEDLGEFFYFESILADKRLIVKTGIHWASSIPAFLALACVPFPFLFYKYGATIRKRCEYAAKSDAFMRKLAEQMQQAPEPESEETEEPVFDRTEAPAPEESDVSETESNVEELPDVRQMRSRASTRTATSLRHVVSYEGNPYDIDRVNTRESFSNKN
jgi:hypothetical protein